MGGDPSPPLHLPNVVSMGLCPLRGEQGSGVANGVSDAVEFGAVVAVGDPYGLAILKAGSGGEAHRVGCG